MSSSKTRYELEFADVVASFKETYSVLTASCLSLTSSTGALVGRPEDTLRLDQWSLFTTSAAFSFSLLCAIRTRRVLRLPLVQLLEMRK